MITSILTLSMTAFAADSSCLLSQQQQRALILNEGPKAIQSQPTSDCFQRLVQDEIEMFKNRKVSLGNDRKGVIQEMLLSAQREEDTKTQGTE